MSDSSPLVRNPCCSDLSCLAVKGRKGSGVVNRPQLFSRFGFGTKRTIVGWTNSWRPGYGLACITPACGQYPLGPGRPALYLSFLYFEQNHVEVLADEIPGMLGYYNAMHERAMQSGGCFPCEGCGRPFEC